MDMIRLNVNISPQLQSCIEKIEADRSDAGAPIKRGSLVEELLRKAADIETAKAALKIDWEDRPGPGAVRKIRPE